MLGAGVIGARRAEEISVEVRQVVVVVLVELDELPMPKAAPTPRADAGLGPNHRAGQDVIAGMAELPIAAAAGLGTGAVADGVGTAARCRDLVEASAVASGDLLEVFAGESERPKLAGIGAGRWVRYPCGVHSDSSFLWAGARERGNARRAQ